jgi:hypothetical protein
VFRIRDVLIRIRILRSVHWITDPNPVSFKRVAKRLFCLLLTVGTFTTVLKVNKFPRSHKTEEKKSRFFLICLLVVRRIQIRTHTRIQIRIRTNSYGSGTSKNLRNLRIRIRNTDANHNVLTDNGISDGYQNCLLVLTK